MKETSEFRQITSARMAHWVEIYLQGFLDTGRFDATAATRAAYVFSTPESYRTLGCQVRSSKKVQTVVSLFLKAVQRDILFDLAEIQRAIDAAEPGSVAQHRLISLKARMRRGIQSEPEDDESAESTGKLVRETPASRVPPGCKPVRDAAGELKGYMDLNNQFVGLAAVEVVR
jgi:hypothetical protein